MLENENFRNNISENIIKILSEDLINKIAAGEVIERPASVVKELVENSLDAGATKIVIEIFDSGKEAIIIRDNGKGMTPEDAEKSIIRHATSKIKNSDDLFAINTLGFRGEALASIAAVSKLRIITKKKNKMEGFSLAVKGGEVIGSGIIAADQGTTIKIENLFYNTPARIKFLKTDAVELRHIINVITQYALLHNAVSFTLLHDDRELINSPAVEDGKSNISSLYGLDIAKELVEISYQDDLIKLNGFIGKPYHARNDRNQQALFVNGRWIKNEDLSKAVYDGYHSILFVNKHPIFVLKLQLNPQRIDVNVHPTKSNIKIEQKEEICEIVCKVVKETLQKKNLLPNIDLNIESQETFNIPKQKPKYGFDKSEQMILKQETKAGYLVSEKFEDDIKLGDGLVNEKIVDDVIELPKQEFVRELNNHSTLPPIKILGQINKTFFAAETPGGMFFIDQHAAHERVLYEQFMGQYMKEGVTVQNLLQPEVIDFTVNDIGVVRENLEVLGNLGFVLSEFGNNSFIIKTLPAVFGRLQVKEIVPELVSKLGKEKIENLKEEIITRMACRSAVMAGDELTITQMGNILKELSRKELPYTCPHGRPTMIKVSVDELEKKFRRKG